LSEKERLMQIHFFNKESLDRVSGGHLYNCYLIDQLRKGKVEVIYYAVDHLISVETFLSKAHQGDVIVIDSLLVVDNLEFVLAYRRQFPTMGMIHLPQIFDPKNQNAEVLPTVFEVERRIFESIPMIVTSPFCKEKVVDAFGLNPNGVYVLEPGVADFKEKTNFERIPFQLLSIATFDVRKGQAKILNALANLKAYDWEIDFYGDMSYDSDYTQLVLDLVKTNQLADRIDFKGTIDHSSINEVMTKADLFVQMSSFESYSMVIAECLSSRLPFVSTRVGAYRSFDKYDGGVFLSDFNEDTLELTLENLFENEIAYRQLWQNKTRKYDRDWLKVADELLDIVTIQRVFNERPN